MVTPFAGSTPDYRNGREENRSASREMRCGTGDALGAAEYHLWGSGITKRDVDASQPVKRGERNGAMAQTTRKAFDERLLTHHPAGQACVEVCLSHGWQPNSADVIRLVKLWD